MNQSDKYRFLRRSPAWCIVGGLFIIIFCTMPSCKKSTTATVSNNILWMKILQNTRSYYDGYNNLKPTNDGGFIMDYSLLSTPANPSFIRFDKNGNELWNRQYSNLYPWYFCVNSNNEVYVLLDTINNFVIDKIDTNGNESTVVSISEPGLDLLNGQLVATSDGGIIAFATMYSFSVAKSILLKIDAGGTLKFSTTIDSTNSAHNLTLGGCIENQDQTYTLSGRSNDQLSLLTTDADGNFTQNITLPTVNPDFNIPSIVNVGGTIYLTVSVTGASYTTMVYRLNTDLSVKDSLSIPLGNNGVSYNINLQNGLCFLLANNQPSPESNEMNITYNYLVRVNADMSGYKVADLQTFRSSFPEGICETSDGNMVLSYNCRSLKNDTLDYCITKINSLW